MKLLLNTVRMVDYDQSREHTFEDISSLEENLALGLLNPGDFKNLNLTSNARLNVSNENGKVIINAKEEETIPEGILLMPVSIWANQLTSILNDEIVYKNIEINVEPTNEPILAFKDLIQSIKYE